MAFPLHHDRALLAYDGRLARSLPLDRTTCVNEAIETTIRAGPMTSIAQLDELKKPIWIALVILGFIFWWPLGFAVLAYTLWSGKMNCCGISFGQWREDTTRQVQDWGREPQTSGNQAFDEYRTATLRRLEEEQHEFREFVTRLRMAKDKAEFDGFMATRPVQSDSPQPQT